MPYFSNCVINNKLLEMTTLIISLSNNCQAIIMLPKYCFKHQNRCKNWVPQTCSQENIQIVKPQFFVCLSVEVIDQIYLGLQHYGPPVSPVAGEIAVAIKN